MVIQRTWRLNKGLLVTFPHFDSVPFQPLKIINAVNSTSPLRVELRMQILASLAYWEAPS